MSEDKSNLKESMDLLKKKPVYILNNRKCEDCINQKQNPYPETGSQYYCCRYWDMEDGDFAVKCPDFKIKSDGRKRN